MLESHADTDARIIVKPTPERARLVYTVNEPACVMVDQVVAPVTVPSVGLGDIKALLRRLRPTTPVQTPPPRPVHTDMEILMVRLLLNAPAAAPEPLPRTANTERETLLQHLLPGAPTRALQPCPAPAVFEDGVVCTIGLGGPLYGTGEAAETPQEMVVASECQDTVRGTLKWDRMYMVDPQLVSGLSCDPVRSVSDEIMRGKSRFFDQRAEKDSVMFGAGATTSNVCPPGMMCKLDCPWLRPYLFVCLGGWPVGIREQPDLANIRGFCWEPGGSHPALFWEIVDCFPYKIAPDTCPDLEFTPGFACRPSDLVTRFGILSASRDFSVSFVQPLSRPSLSVPWEIITECFSFDVSCSCVIDVGGPDQGC